MIYQLKNGIISEQHEKKTARPEESRLVVATKFRAVSAIAERIKTKAGSGNKIASLREASDAKARLQDLNNQPLIKLRLVKHVKNNDNGIIIIFDMITIS